MTESTATEVQELVQQGRAAALAGDTYAARTSFRRATELDPKCVDAWAGLSGVVPILAEKHEYLQRALDLEPDNDDIVASLRYVEQLQAEGVQIEPSRRRAERLASSDASPLLSTPEPVVIATEIEYCYRHPDRFNRDVDGHAGDGVEADVAGTHRSNDGHQDVHRERVGSNERPAHRSFGLRRRAPQDVFHRSQQN